MKIAVRFYSRVALSLLAGTVPLVTPVVGHTADSDVADSSAPGPGEPPGLAEIVVTAQKHAEKLQDVPISITSVSTEQLEQRGISDVQSLPQTVSSMRMDWAGNTVQPTIRGVGSDVAGPGLNSNVAIYVDGFYIPDPAMSDINLVNISSVNVLKGPQGTLFGYNATGGAIQISTPNPTPDPSGFVKVGWASYNDLSTAFYGTTGVTDTLSVNVAGSYESGDGYITNIVTHDPNAGKFSTWSFRPKVLWTPTDDISFLLAYTHNYTNNPWSNNSVARDRQTIGVIIPGNIIATEPKQVSNNAPNFVHLITDSANLTSTFKFSFADLTSYSQWRADGVSQGLEYDDTPANIYAAQWKVPDKTITQEFDLTSKPGSKLEWVVGTFYMHLQDTYAYATNSAVSPDGTGAPWNPIFSSTNKTDSYAVFADATYEIAPQLFFTAGGRYSSDHPELKFDLYPASYIASGNTSFTNFSPRGVLRYQLTPESNVYASYTQGYKAGALPGSAFSFTPVQPEKIDAYEVGYKIRNNNLQLNVAGFFYNYKDIQVTAEGAGGTSVTRNAASAHIYGTDGDLVWQIVPQFNVNLSGSYIHARYESFPDAIGFRQDLTPTSASYGQFVTYNVDATGMDVSRTPTVTGNIGGTYSVPFFRGNLDLNASLSYSSSFYFDSVQQDKQDGFALLNLRASWTDPSEKYHFSVYGTNVTNKTYFAASFYDPFGLRSVYGPPAMFGGNVTVRF